MPFKYTRREILEKIGQGTLGAMAAGYGFGDPLNRPIPEDDFDCNEGEETDEDISQAEIDSWLRMRSKRGTPHGM